MYILHNIWHIVTNWPLRYTNTKLFAAEYFNVLPDKINIKVYDNFL